MPHNFHTKPILFIVAPKLLTDFYLRRWVIELWWPDLFFWYFASTIHIQDQKTAVIWTNMKLFVDVLQFFTRKGFKLFLFSPLKICLTLCINIWEYYGFTLVYQPLVLCMTRLLVKGTCLDIKRAWMSSLAISSRMFWQCVVCFEITMASLLFT